MLERFFLGTYTRVLHRFGAGFVAVWTVPEGASRGPLEWTKCCATGLSLHWLCSKNQKCA